MNIYSYVPPHPTSSQIYIYMYPTHTCRCPHIYSQMRPHIFIDAPTQAASGWPVSRRSLYWPGTSDWLDAGCSLGGWAVDVLRCSWRRGWHVPAWELSSVAAGIGFVPESRYLNSTTENRRHITIYIVTTPFILSHVHLYSHITIYIVTCPFILSMSIYTGVQEQ